MNTYHVEIAFTQPVLGTANSDPNIHERFIASKAPDAPSTKQEVAALGVEEVLERGTTVFPRTTDGTPFLWNYQLKGYFKDAAKFCREMDGGLTKGVPAYKSKIDGLIKVEPRNIRLVMPEGSEVKVMQRSLRAETAQGPRVALASSEMLPAGTTCECWVTLAAEKVGAKTKVDFAKCLIEWLAYGTWRGIGQWRNADWGQFVCRVTDTKTGEVVFDNMR